MPSSPSPPLLRIRANPPPQSFIKNMAKLLKNFLYDRVTPLSGDDHQKIPTPSFLQPSCFILQIHYYLFPLFSPIIPPSPLCKNPPALFFNFRVRSCLCSLYRVDRKEGGKKVISAFSPPPPPGWVTQERLSDGKSFLQMRNPFFREFFFTHHLA